VYLLAAHSYPFVSTTDDEWHSFITFPSKFVPESDKGIPDSKKSEAPAFEVPFDSSKFEHLRPYLLKSPTDGLGTAEALYNCRLVGLYFSAHWCGRTFPFVTLRVSFSTFFSLSLYVKPAAHLHRCCVKCTRS
jgi:hypothetical protein